MLSSNNSSVSVCRSESERKEVTVGGLAVVSWAEQGLSSTQLPSVCLTRSCKMECGKRKKPQPT